MCDAILQWCIWYPLKALLIVAPAAMILFALSFLAETGLLPHVLWFLLLSCVMPVLGFVLFFGVVSAIVAIGAIESAIARSLARGKNE